LLCCVLAVSATARSFAQEPRPADKSTYVEGAVGNQILQVRALTPSPISEMPGDLDYGLLISENRDIIASSALMFDANISALPRLRFEIGPQAYLALLAAEQKTDVFALALGANASYDLFRSIGFSIIGHAFYSPGVLTFGSAHNLYDFMAGGQFAFTPQLTVQAGYRWLKFTLVNEPDERVSNEAFVGLRWRLH
jgi:hypothetical protein